MSAKKSVKPTTKSKPVEVNPHYDGPMISGKEVLARLKTFKPLGDFTNGIDPLYLRV